MKTIVTAELLTMTNISDSIYKCAKNPEIVAPTTASDLSLYLMPSFCFRPDFHITMHKWTETLTGMLTS